MILNRDIAALAIVVAKTRKKKKRGKKNPAAQLRRPVTPYLLPLPLLAWRTEWKGNPHQDDP